MTLTDAGPLIALIDGDEPDHDACLETAEELPLPLVTTWPAFTEAMYLLGRAGGSPGQQALWRLVHTGRLVIADLSQSAVERTSRLMDQYADGPMDLADATLVALAEERGYRRIFTLDSEFHVYRIRGRTRFEVVPAS
ncbi:MAG: type II toxin-antitoxin system VapC family toxin [Acidimicrobiales bacterium]